MTPLARVGWGFLVVVVDIRLEGLDVLPDPIGWALALSGWFALQARSTWFGGAVGAGVAGLVASVFAVTQPPEGVPALVDALASTAAVFCTCSAIIQLASSAADRKAADMIRWIDLVVGILAFLLVSAGDADGLAAVVLVLIVVALATLVWFLVLVFRVGREPALAG